MDFELPENFLPLIIIGNRKGEKDLTKDVGIWTNGDMLNDVGILTYLFSALTHGFIERIPENQQLDYMKMFQEMYKTMLEENAGYIEHKTTLGENDDNTGFTSDYND